MVQRDVRLNNTEKILTDLQDRVRRLENRVRLTVGAGLQAYALEVDPVTGNLTARHTTTGTITVLAVP